MQSNPTPITKDLVLMGGGHSHAIVLRMWGMKPLPGVRLTLLSERGDAAYSGMLPGHIAGYYRHDECHIDLRPLAQFAGAQFLVDQAIGLDLQQNRILCAHRPPLNFDLLSIDIGSTPFIPACLNQTETTTYSLTVKPVHQFLARWQQIVEQTLAHPATPLSIGIVGGGVGGVELALAVQQRLEAALASPELLDIHLFHRGAQLLEGHSTHVKRQFYHLLRDRGIHLHLKEAVIQVQDHQVIGESGLQVFCDYVFWVTDATAPTWIEQAGLAVDGKGFIQVNQGLQSISHPQVFASGDIATIVNHPRPKAGVFAVRQGRPLYDNLRRALRNYPLRTYHPQRHYLNLIGAGTGSAIASRGSRFGLGPAPLLWTWKEWVDRRFMERFAHLPVMQQPRSIAKPSELPDHPAPGTMYCAGCGSKVGSSVLQRVLQRVLQEYPQGSRTDILLDMAAAEDGAVVQVPPGKVLVQTVDYFRSLLNDPFVFGQIAAHHALSDLFAMGAVPQSALAIATIPYGSPARVEESLYQLLSGAIQVLQQVGAVLIGGHTIEGTELALGLSCNGIGDPNQLLRKAGLQVGQVLILTKALGTGVLFAADMQYQAQGHWIETAIQSMLQSNQQAARCLIQHGATACTDVTGFGLFGHVLEMVRASQVAVTLELEALPILPGAREALDKGFLSSLHPQNLQAAQSMQNLAQFTQHPHVALLFDPQTSGGLVAGVPIEQADACLTALKQAGYEASQVVGRVHPPVAGQFPIQLLEDEANR